MSSLRLENFKHLNSLKQDINNLWIDEFKAKSNKIVDVTAIQKLMQKYELKNGFELFAKLIKIKFNVPLTSVRDAELVEYFADLGLFILEKQAGVTVIKHNCLQLLLYVTMTDGLLPQEKQFIRQRINTGALFNDPKFNTVLEKMLEAVSLEKSLVYSKVVSVVMKKLAKQDQLRLGDSEELI